jgi:MFS family permease
MTSTRPYRYLRRWSGLAGVLTAQAAALTANRSLLVAVPWLALIGSDNPAAAGLVGVCHTAPYVVTQILAGPLIDRLGPRTVAVGGDLISALAIGVLAAAGSPPVWLLAATMACVGAVDGPAASAKTVWLPKVTAAAGRTVQFGTGHATAVERGATMLGPIGAGLLLAGFGTRVLWLIGLLFAAAAAISLANRGRLPRREPEGRYLRQLRAGAAFLRHERSLTAMTLMFVIGNALDALFLTVLLPVWARQHGYGPALIGVAAGVFGAGAVVTALLTARIGHRLPPRTAYLITSPLGGVSRLLIIAVDAPPTVVIAVFVLAGFGSGTANVLLDAAQIQLIPEHLHGRVRTLINASAWLGIPLGSAAGAVGAGLLTALLPAALWTCGGIYLAAIVSAGRRITWPTTDFRRGAPIPAPQQAGHPRATSRNSTPQWSTR